MDSIEDRVAELEKQVSRLITHVANIAECVQIYLLDKELTYGRPDKTTEKT